MGESTDEDFREAGKWLARKHKATKAKYGFCLPALDVECLSIRLATGCNLPDLEFEMLSNDDGKVVAPIAMPGDKGNILKLPVLLMYGGVGWQLHLRIPVKYKTVGSERHVEVSDGNAEAAHLTRLFHKFHPAVGAVCQISVAYQFQHKVIGMVCTSTYAMNAVC